ncbi:hypothetical protein P67b_00081 [Ruegeria phage Tedan]|nr:hypothetical protein P67b_00081 [Ruegeria phage Tedan]
MVVRAGGAADPRERIERLIQQQDARFRGAFELAISILLTSSTLDALADLLEQGLFEDALSTLEDAGRALGNQYGASLVAAAQDTATWLSTSALTVAVSYDVANTRAVNRVQQNRLRIIRDFTEEQRRATRAALAIGTERGLNPREQARAFRASIGLTERQVRAVDNYRRLLEGGSLEVLQRELRDRRFDRAVRSARSRGEPLTADQVNRMTEAYRRRYINFRAETIARTEALRATHEGVEEMYAQAIDDGQINPDGLSRRWLTARDRRVRDSHVLLNGLERPLGETFPGGDGPLRFPGDPEAPATETVQCRCVLVTRLTP